MLWTRARTRLQAKSVVTGQNKLECGFVRAVTRAGVKWGALRN